MPEAVTKECTTSIAKSANFEPKNIDVGNRVSDKGCVQPLSPLGTQAKFKTSVVKKEERKKTVNFAKYIAVSTSSYKLTNIYKPE